MSVPEAAEPGATRVGWIGTGVMGASMCGHVLDAGFDVTLTTRTRSKADPLVAKGAKFVETPAEVARASDVVVSIVGYPSDVREVILGESGVLAAAAEGSILVDMTTSEPSLAVEIAKRASAQGVRAIDAPVSGGDVGAREARLSIMLGGDPDAVSFVRPVLDCFGRNVRHLGGPGAGQHTKMANQVLIASTMVGLAESLLYAARAGLDVEEVVAAIAKGAAGCWSLDNYGPRILRRDFDPGFFVEHFVKDMGIALDEASRLGLALPGLALARQLYHSLVAHGHEKSGTQALVLVLEQLANSTISVGAGDDASDGDGSPEGGRRS